MMFVVGVVDSSLVACLNKWLIGGVEVVGGDWGMDESKGRE